MKILITNQAQTYLSKDRIYEGHKENELNPFGYSQSQHIASALPCKIDYIFSSPLKRTVQMAKIINQKRKLPIITDSRIIDRYWGALVGKTKWEGDYLKESYPLLEYIWDYNKNIDILWIETVHDLFSRVYSFLDDITKRYSDSTVLIVTHENVILPMRCYLTNYPLEKVTSDSIFPQFYKCEILEFDVWKYYYI